MASGTDVNLFVKLCGQGAPVASVGLFLAPIPTIQQIVNTGTVGSLPLLPYSTMASSAFLWTAYGVMKQEPKIWSCNGIGLVLSIFYSIQFVRNIPKAKQASILEATTPTLPGNVAQHVQGVSMVFLTTSLLAILKPFGPKRTDNVLGNACVLFCILMFASPLSVIRVVLETKSAKSIPLPFTVVSCLNCFMWMMFGLFEMKDVNIYLPNILGLSFGIVQVILKLLFGDHNNDMNNNNLLPSYQGISPASTP